MSPTRSAPRRRGHRGAARRRRRRRATSSTPSAPPTRRSSSPSVSSSGCARRCPTRRSSSSRATTTPRARSRPARSSGSSRSWASTSPRDEARRFVYPALGSLGARGAARRRSLPASAPRSGPKEAERNQRAACCTARSKACSPTTGSPARVRRRARRPRASSARGGVELRRPRPLPRPARGRAAGLVRRGRSTTSSPNIVGRAGATRADHGVQGKGWLLVDLDDGAREADAGAAGAARHRPRADPSGDGTPPEVSCARSRSGCARHRRAASPTRSCGSGCTTSRATSRASSTTRRSARSRPRRCTSISTSGGRDVAARRSAWVRPAAGRPCPSWCATISSRRPLPAELDREALRAAGRRPDGRGRARRGGRLMRINRLRLRQLPAARGHRARVRGRASPASSGRTGRGRPRILEAIAWAMYGMPRRAGQPGHASAAAGRRPRARVEVELDFALGPHHYRIVRSLHGAELYPGRRSGADREQHRRGHRAGHPAPRHDPRRVLQHLLHRAEGARGHGAR